MNKNIRILLLIFTFLLMSKMYAQQYGNEWIVPGQNYYKIPTAQNGLYAVTYNQLQSVGINLSTVDPRNIQLWHRGVEQKIWIKGQDDGVFHTTDSLIFYGQMNDGTLDTKMYEPQSSQPHKYYNTYNDTTAYFLTWTNAPSTQRMEFAPTNAVVTPESFHMEEYLKVFTDQYGQGMFYGEALMTYGDKGETWCSSVSSAFNEFVPVSNIYNAGANYTLDIMIVGRNRIFNRLVTITVSNLNVANKLESFPIFNLGDKSFFSKSYPASELNNSGININLDGNTIQWNEYSIAYIKLKYPQLVSMNGATSKIFYTANTTTDKLYSIAWPYSSAPVVVDLTDKSHPRLLTTNLNSGTLNVNVPAGVTNFLVTQNSNFINPPTIKSVDLNPYSANADFIIVTHSKLWSSAQQYADYRASNEGGGHNVLLTDVERLYDLHSYGEYTPIGIKQFCDYQRDYNPNIKDLFIIGKGLNVYYGARLNLPYYRKNPTFYINNTSEQQIENLVPPYGNPGSDIYYAMRKEGPKYMPYFAVGRLSAKTNQDVLDYLDKVREHDALDSNLLWRKQLVHLSGGLNQSEIQLFRSYVDGFKGIAENSNFKGKVIKTYQFNQNNGFSINEVPLAEDVNNGLNVLTYYGHSTLSVTQIDIGKPSQPIYGYNNKGKYPILMLMGCETAAVFFSPTSLSEDWVNAKERGAIATLGVTEVGYTGPLRNYTDWMYTGMFATDSLRNKPIGQVMKNVLRVGYFDDQTTHQMNLQGDPGIRIYSPPRTDYEISGDKEIRDDKPELKCFLKNFNNTKVTAADDSFLIGIPVKNFGIYNKEKFKIIVKRTSNGKETTYKEVEYPPVNFIDTLYFTIRDNDESYFGINNFYVKVDSRDTIHEMREDNNEANIEYFMALSGVICIYPKEFSVVHAQPITFVAQATNLLVDQRQYYFELDTTYKFNSGFKKTSIITSGSLIKWPNVNLYSDNNIDSIVYYWRVRFNNFMPGEDTVWATSSFIYIKESPEGWSQSEAPQFMKDAMKNIYMDLADSTWKFKESSQYIKLEVHGNRDGLAPVGSGYDVDSTNFRIGETNALFPGYATARCGSYGGSLGDEEYSYEINGIAAVALNKSTLENYLVPGYSYCGRWPDMIINQFYTTGGNVGGFNNWLNAIPEGDIIVFGNSGNAGFTGWSAEIKNNLKNNFGAQLIDNASDNEPYLFVGRKGASTPIAEKHSDDRYASLSLDTTIASRYNNGRIVSTRIGPTNKWGTFLQRTYSSGDDIHEFKIVGESLDGTIIDTLNIDFNFQTNADGIKFIDLESQINANVYPYIKLICMVYDSSTSLTPPQLNRWQVLYERVPEGTMDPFTAGLNNYNITRKDEGASVCIPYVFENISNLPFQDSLRVRVSLRGEGSVLRDTSYLVYPGILNPGESFRFTHCATTKGITGRVIFSTFVNPYNQPEEYYSNNVIEVSFDVVRDRIPPVIDVLFDGVHIMDGDIVSPSPMITIVLNDNSKFLLVEDPNNISLFFKKANTPEIQILPTNPDILKFGQTPGNGNTFTIEFNPKDLEDGEYSIVVQGRDVNGNKSGQYYEVKFTVVNASTITNFYPYPNPFSTSTRFVFTLTGKFVPEDLKIQIMTVTGKVVREITKEELGHIHIGNNKTEYAWNGTDEFGDKLANGVYLYRVVIKNKGDNYEHRNTAGDKAFKKEFGKLYILR